MKNNTRAWENAWSKGEVTASVNITLPFLKFRSHLRVLDIGCGNGTLLNRLKEHYNIEPVGIDIVAFKNYKHSFVKADAQHLPFKDCSFDIVYGLGSIEHCESTQQALNESFRILKNKGQALFTFPNKLSLHTLLERPLRQRAKLWSIGLEQSFSTGEMCRMYTLTGFSSIRYSVNYWDTKKQSLPARCYMILDNALSKVSKNWGFFVCAFGTKQISKHSA